MAQLYTINGVKVQFPCKPYPSQFAMMDKIMKGLERRQNCLLESPTGSGKSLALLCAALAWQKAEKEKADEANNARSAEAACKCDCHAPTTILKPVSDPVSSVLGTAANAAGAPIVIGDDDDDDFRESTISSRLAAKNRIETKPVVGAPVETPSHPSSAKSTSDIAGAGSPACTACSCGRSDHGGYRKVPKIYFATRTHKQIAQLVRELKKTAYKNVRMTVLSSREHTCIHPDISEAPNKNEGCSDLLDGPGCSYHNKVRTFASHPMLESHGFGTAWDLEDFVMFYRKHKTCPYFGARQLKSTADLVLCPYNYLIDPRIRKSMEISLSNQVIILDESHNMEDAAREAASFILTQKQLQAATFDLRTMLNYRMMVPELTSLLALVEKLQRLMTESEACATQSNYNEVCKVWTGIEMVALLANHGIGVTDIVYYQRCYEKLSEEKVGEGEGDANEVKFKGAPRLLLEGFFVQMDFMLRENMKFVDDFRVALTGAMVYDDGYNTNGEWLSKRRGQGQMKWAYSLNFWCLNPGVAFSDLGSVSRAIVLTSGTLSPMNSFQSELGVPFPIQLEASHVVDKSQIWVGSLAKGPRGCSLLGTFQNVDTFLYQDDIGDVVLSTCQTVPHGVLCFFSSYKVLEKMVTRWQRTGLWQQINALKAVMVEPRAGDRVDFDDLLRSYYDTIQHTTSAGGSMTGALFLAVCRGKVSEGLDFADNNARAVIVVGIPYPNVKDTQVEMKKQYNDRYTNQRGLLNGRSWYEIQAFRALNQALGRCIRHRHDWGALILADERFGKSPQLYTKGLSKWVREKALHYATFSDLNQSLACFIAERKEYEAANPSLNTSLNEVTELSPPHTSAVAGQGLRSVTDALMPRVALGNVGTTYSSADEPPPRLPAHNKRQRNQKPRQPRKPLNQNLTTTNNSSLLKTPTRDAAERDEVANLYQAEADQWSHFEDQQVKMENGASNVNCVDQNLIPTPLQLLTEKKIMRAPEITSAVLPTAASVTQTSTAPHTVQASASTLSLRLAQNVQRATLQTPTKGDLELHQLPTQVRQLSALPIPGAQVIRILRLPAAATAQQLPTKTIVLLPPGKATAMKRFSYPTMRLPLGTASPAATSTALVPALSTTSASKTTLSAPAPEMIVIDDDDEEEQTCMRLEITSTSTCDNAVNIATDALEAVADSDQFSSMAMDTQLLVATDNKATSKRVRSVSPDLFDSGCSRDSVDNIAAAAAIADVSNNNNNNNKTTSSVPAGMTSVLLSNVLKRNLPTKVETVAFVKKHVVKSAAKGVVFTDSPEKPTTNATEPATVATPVGCTTRDSKLSKLSLSEKKTNNTTVRNMKKTVIKETVKNSYDDPVSNLDLNDACGNNDLEKTVIENLSSAANVIASETAVSQTVDGTKRQHKSIKQDRKSASANAATVRTNNDEDIWSQPSDIVVKRPRIRRTKNRSSF